MPLGDVAHTLSSSVRQRTEEMACKSYNISGLQHFSGMRMMDAYVYYFTTLDGSTGESVRSKRPATLESIKGKGEPVMESQMVVDQIELDHNGFLATRVVNHSHPIDDLTDEIRSLNLRADSRDSEALQLDESTEGVRKYMLSLESRELRNQARRLQKQHTELMADESGGTSGTQGLAQFGGDPVTG